MLVVFPLGLWTFSFICDFVHWAGWGGSGFALTSLYCMGAGIIGAIAASIPGFMDFLSITNDTVKKTAAFHMVLNVAAMFLYTANFFLRVGGAVDFGASLVLSGATIAILIVSGWLGGELVYIHRVGVTEEHEEEHRLGEEAA